MNNNGTIYFDRRPKIISTGTVAGPEECKGAVGKFVDIALKDDMFGEKTFERAECKMVYSAIEQALKGAKCCKEEVDVLFCGDLLNQIISSSFAARDMAIAYLGVYSACSTMTEALMLAASFVNAGYAGRALAATGSHFATAERQYRYPLEQGTTRPPQSQSTVTGAGSCLISLSLSGISVVSATIGRVIDFGVKDVNNMGAAMAPACCDSLLRHFKNTHTSPKDYDLILTGDLGSLGSSILDDLLWEKGYDISPVHRDCGVLIYDMEHDLMQGGSGAGCSAIVFNSIIYNQMLSGKYCKVLFAATGALLSTVSSGQGQSIPSISHVVQLER
jgi:stage V sporulation protein AD